MSSEPVIQFPLLTGAGSEAGLTQAPGAQLLLINVEMYVSPIGFGGAVVYHGEASQSGSIVFGNPCPVDKEAGLGKFCARPMPVKQIVSTNNAIPNIEDFP